MASLACCAQCLQGAMVPALGFTSGAVSGFTFMTGLRFTLPFFTGGTDRLENTTERFSGMGWI